MLAATERRIAVLSGDQQKMWRLLGPSLYGTSPLLPITLREMAQNSRDAIVARRLRENIRGKISITVTESEGGRWEVVCNDNGCGMDEDVILDRFLQLGGSLKAEGAKVVGGFGIAKAAIIGACSDFRLRTHDNYLDSGMIGREPIRKLSRSDSFDGCSISLGYDLGIESTLLPNQTSLMEAVMLLATSDLGVECDLSLNRLRDVRWHQVLPGTVRKNDPIYEDESFVIHQLKLDEQFPFLADEFRWIWAAEFTHRGSAFIRLNGLTQFRQGIGWAFKTSFLVDVKIPEGLKPGQPNYPFTPSREELIDELAAKLDRILDRHRLNPVSSEAALKDRKTKSSTTYYDGRCEGKSRYILAEERHEEKERRLSEELHERFSSISHTFADDVFYGGYSPTNTKTCVRIVGPSWVNPLCEKNLKLLLAWTEILRTVHEAGDVFETYGTGFVIRDIDVIAERYVDSRRDVYYLLNPRTLKTSDPMVVFTLLYEAAHEIAHADYTDHDEWFTRRQGDLYRSALNDRKLFQRLRAILNPKGQGRY